MKRSIGALAAAMAVALAAVGCSESPQQAKSGGTYTTVELTHAIDPQAPINPWAGKGNSFSGYSAMPLAFRKNHLTDHNQHYPGIAESWQVSADGAEVTIKIQPKAKWSDGTDVTSEDIKTSAAVAFTQGGSVFAISPGSTGSLGEVTIVDAKTIKFTQAPGARNNIFLYSLLNMWVLPKSVYGPQLPADFWDKVKTGAQNTDAGKAARDELAALGKKIITFGPPKDVSAGPFVLESVNASEAILVKNPHFFNADKIGPDKVRLRNYTGNEQIWNYLTAGELDGSPFTATPTNVVEQILKVPGSAKLTGMSQVSAALAFNQKYAPFDKVQVRKALAHLIDRGEVQKIGAPDSGSVAEHTSGLIEGAAKAWIGDAELAKLDPYKVDRARAETLLTQAGLSKQDGKWMLPNGQPFAFKLQVPNGFSDWVAAGKNIASQLTNAGIAVEAQTSADYAVYQKEMAEGKYAAGFWLVALGPSTYNAYSRLYGGANGWSAFGGQLTHKPAGEGGNWMGGAETATIPGYGTLNPGQLTYQLSQLPVDQAKDTIVKLANYTSDQLPAIQMWNYVNVQFVNTSRFENFPPNDCECLRLSHGVWMQLGYIQPKK
ncbi:ABC transporter substrate-binding protein [Allorhizocola rhizosphaerae]|uniref:ABC transporter substrate-binding protein n=1 Tax=Allorhizocola rhizosphaerae TaxID=1872709 RepID=UPI000E3EE2C0|nr:ABC transporter substrate-binding protein [Allorhizocola rhizosphaerae]